MKKYELKNDVISILVVPEVGGLITSIKYLPTQSEILYKHREPLPFSEWKEDFPRVDGIHSFFSGGWFEVIPNAGYATEYAGEKWGLHGESPYLPWEAKFDEPFTIEMSVKLRRYPLALWKQISLVNNSIIVKESLRNESPIDLYFSWLHHPTFGGDLLSEHTTLELDADLIEVDKELGLKYTELEPGFKGKWPYAKARDGNMVDLTKYPSRGVKNTNDLVYVPKVRSGHFRIENKKARICVEGKWDKNVFPTLWIWRALGGGAESPWFGTIYATSVEITTSWPASGLAEQVKRGTAAKILAKEEIKTELRFFVKDF